MKIKILDKDSNSITYEELVDHIEDLIDSENFDSIKAILDKHIQVVFNKEEEFNTTFKLLNRILVAINKSPNNQSSISAYFINLSGLLCAKLDLGKESLYLYLLALLSGRSVDRTRYYNNVGSSLANLENFELANTFYLKALAFIDSYYEPNGLNIFGPKNLTILNQAISCIKLGDYEKGKEWYQKVDTDNLQFIHVEYAYEYIGKYIKLLDIKDPDKAVDFIQKVDEKNGMIGFKLRNHIINHLPMSSAEKYALLKENHAFLSRMTSEKDRIECLTRLIKLAKELNRKEDELLFLNQLYEVNLQKNDFGKIASQIIVEQYVQFFNKLTQINSQIKNQKDELQKLTFILSHNLKTPIRNICGFSQLLKKKYSSTLDSEAEEFLNFIDNGSNELNELLNKILHISNYNTKNESKSAVDLDQVVSNLETELCAFSKKEIKIIRKSKLPVVKARVSDMHELFKILIENGIKFNNSQIPTVLIEHTLKDDKLVINISDNGIGIDSFGQKKIFNFFTKMENKAMYEGTGFGLGMAKKIMDYYQGQIFLKKTGSKGTAFSFELPANLIVSQKKNQLQHN